MGKARNTLTGKSYSLLSIAYSRFFYAAKFLYNKYKGYSEFKRGIVLNGNSKIGVHHKTLFTLKNSKIIVNNGSLKIGIDFGYFDGGIYDSKNDRCKIYLINSTFEINGNVTLYPGVVIYAINASIKIGNDTQINKGVELISANKIEIGEGCRLAQGIIVRDNDGHKTGTGDGDGEDLENKEIKIGNHCWIGQNSMVLKGVTLADNTIVSAGSVVAKNFPPNVAIAGNPARIIKENVSWKA